MRSMALRCVRPVESDQLHQMIAAMNGQANFHMSPNRSKFQAAGGPMPVQFITNRMTPMTTNSMAAGPARREQALYRIDAGAAGHLQVPRVLRVLRALAARAAALAMAAWVTMPAPALASEALARQRNCLNCHGMERKVVGPGFRQVAVRYAGQKDATAYLAEKIVKGGAGAWGPVAMAANPQVSKEEAARLAAWVLSLK